MDISASDFDTLRSRISGSVFARGDDIAAVTTGANLAATYDPDAVVVAASEEDVQEAVRFAAQHQLHVHIQSTGHGAEGALDSGLLLITSRLDELSVDPGARVATIGAGVRWGAVVEAASQYGLLPITGSSPMVGAIGYTLGGGLGPLARSHGFSSDYVRSFRVVTGDGDVVVADSDHHPELFWALRGGKAGFGVVTSMDFGLVDLAEIYGGSLIFDTADIETALRGWIAWTADAPAEATTSIAIVRFPPFDTVPPPFRGKTLLALRFAEPGHHGEGHARPLRALATPMADLLGDMPTSKIAMIHNDPTEPSASWVMGLAFRELDDDFVSALLGVVGADQESFLVAVELRHIGNRTAQDVPEGSAVGGRDALFVMNTIGAIHPGATPDQIAANYGRLESAVAAWKLPVTTINFAGHPTPAEFEASWPADIFARLQRARAEYDPSGRFSAEPDAG